MPVGGVLKIYTTGGTFALKRAGKGGEPHWREVAEVGRHLLPAEGGRIPIPLCTRSGRVTFAGHGPSYVLLPWILGRPIPYTARRIFGIPAGGWHGFTLERGGLNPSLFRMRVSWSRAWERTIDRIGLYRVAVDRLRSDAEADDAFRDAVPYAEGMVENAS